MISLNNAAPKRRPRLPPHRASLMISLNNAAPKPAERIYRLDVCLMISLNNAAPKLNGKRVPVHFV